MSAPAEAIERLTGYYTTIADKQSKGLEAYRRVDAERPHILAVLEKGVKQRCWDGVVKLTLALDSLPDPSGSGADVSTLTVGLKAARAIQDQQAEATFLNSLGKIYFGIGEWNKAFKCFQESLSISMRLGDTCGLAETYYYLGLIYYKKGKWDEALKNVQESLSISERLGDRRGLIRAYDNLALFYRGKKEIEKAFEYSHRASELLGDTYGLACDYYSQGSYYHRKGEPENAIKDLQRALALYQRSSEETGWHEGEMQVHILDRLINAYGSLGQFKEAGKCLDKALEIDPTNVSLYNSLANAYLKWGKFKEAIIYYQERIKRQPEDALNAHVCLGVIAHFHGHETEAQQHFITALNIGKVARVKDLQSEINYQENVAIARLGLGDIEAAITILKRSLNPYFRHEIIDFTRYDLLAQAPNPPPGLETIRRLLEEFIEMRIFYGLA